VVPKEQDQHGETGPHGSHLVPLPDPAQSLTLPGNLLTLGVGIAEPHRQHKKGEGDSLFIPSPQNMALYADVSGKQFPVTRGQDVGRYQVREAVAVTLGGGHLLAGAA